MFVWAAFAVLSACVPPVDDEGHIADSDVGHTDIADTDATLPGVVRDLAVRPVLHVSILPIVPHPGALVRCDVTGAFNAVRTWRLDGDVIDTAEEIVTPNQVGGRLSCEARTADGRGVPATDEVVIGTVPQLGNILVLVADDIGVERLGAYGMGTAPPPTHNIDSLAEEGVRFTRAWATPSCSPTRATIISGRYGFRTGYGKASNAKDGWALPDDQPSIAEWVRDESPTSYASAAVGKWHLSNFAAGHGMHPVHRGFGTYRGNPGNLRRQETVDGGNQGFYNYEYANEDVVTRRTEYLTTSEIDDAIELAQSLPEPWFLYVAFHAAHLPAHIPPSDLYTPPVLVPGQASNQERYDATTEALDREIGRLLDVIDANNTTVIFLGDNGTEPGAASGPYPSDEVKLSMFEGGIRIPLIIRGPGVVEPGSESSALVHTSDIFATIAELAGAPVDPNVLEIDGVSLVPYMADPLRPSLRRLAYTERFFDNGYGPYTTYKKALRDQRYKLQWDMDEGYALYDVGFGWFDGDDLLQGSTLDADAQRAFDHLAGVMEGPRFRR